MKALAQDTSLDTERVLIQLWREMPAWRKMELYGICIQQSKPSRVREYSSVFQMQLLMKSSDA
jgi:hypothetical protein